MVPTFLLEQSRFPGGFLVAEDHMDHKGAMRTMGKAIADLCIPAIYEEAFQYDDIRVRADILVRREGSFGSKVDQGQMVRISYNRFFPMTGNKTTFPKDVGTPSLTI